ESGSACALHALQHSKMPVALPKGSRSTRHRRHNDDLVDGVSTAKSFAKSVASDRLGMFLQIGNAALWPDMLGCLSSVADAYANIGVHISFLEAVGRPAALAAGPVGQLGGLIGTPLGFV
ncbi:unnamed protein product, partial [Polarella glacialis]